MSACQGGSLYITSYQEVLKERTLLPIWGSTTLMMVARELNLVPCSAMGLMLFETKTATSSRESILPRMGKVSMPQYPYGTQQIEVSMLPNLCEADGEAASCLTLPQMSATSLSTLQQACSCT